MIGILDQFEIDATALAALQALVFERYQPAAAARGLSLARSWLSPPLALTDGPNTLWVLWEVPDIGAFWNMRFRAGADPETPAYWAAVDRLCRQRQRHYLIDNQPAASLPQPLPLHAERITDAQGARITAQCFIKTDCDPAALAAWEAAVRTLPGQIPGLLKVALARNLEGSFGAGDYTIDVHFENSDALRAAARAAPWTALFTSNHATVERAIVLETALISGGLRQPALKNAIKRTAFFRLLPSAPAAAVAAWERAILDMPVYMAGMTNWSLSRSLDEAWTYIWEQEFERLDDLLGEYMLHPHHWSHIDTWFDPEFSRQIIDTELVHAFCPVGDSVLAWQLDR